MKKSFLTLLLLTGFASMAQIVNIPDPGLKGYLAALNIDTNNDDEIQVSEALNWTGSLSINGTGTINGVSYDINSLEGLEAFVNLYQLILKNLDLTTITVPTLPSLNILRIESNIAMTTFQHGSLPLLKELVFTGNTSYPTLNATSLPTLEKLTANQISALDLTGLSNLTDLSCLNCNLTTIDVSTLEMVAFIDLSSSPLTSVDVSNLANLKDFRCDDCELTSINTTGANSLEKLYLNNNNFQSLDLTQNTSVKEVFCSYNELTTGTLFLPPSIQHLRCSSNQFTELNLQLWPNLLSLACDSNSITSLDISMTNINDLNCSSNGMSTLTLNATEYFSSFECMDNDLSSLDLNGRSFGYLAIKNNMLEGALDVTVNQVWLYNNNFTSIKLTGGPIDEFEVSGMSNLVSVDVSGVSEFYNWMTFENNPQLEYINMKNGNLTGVTDIFLDNNPSLQFICIDPGNESYFDLPPDSEIVLSSYCSFSPGGEHNIVTGTVRYDLNGDGCDASDVPAEFVQLKTTMFSFDFGSTMAGQNGNFTNYTTAYNGEVNFTLTPQVQNPYFTINPPSYTSDFSGYGNTANVDFCLTPNGDFPDLDISLVALESAQPGFDTDYKIIVTNKGTTVQTGTIALTFDELVLDLVTSSPAVSTGSGNMLTWNFGSLSPFESQEIDITFNVNAPTETPAVNIGDILSFVAEVTSSSTDTTPDDNSATLVQTVVGSYDPNDKAVSEGSQILLEQADEYLHYLVRFQNTGSAPATNVVVKDVLSTNLNWATLEIEGASHPMRTTVRSGRIVEFIFENINLPAEQDNEPASHGFVTFKIKPAATAALGTVITNTAEIYFDFNFPIITNTVSTTVVPELSTGEFELKEISIHPNPVNDHFSISGINEISSVKIFNQLGQMVRSIPNQQISNQQIINIAELPQGTYIIKVSSDSVTATAKLIKS